jgi:hypothetical protein
MHRKSAFGVFALMASLLELCSQVRNLTTGSLEMGNSRLEEMADATETLVLLERSRRFY